MTMLIGLAILLLTLPSVAVVGWRNLCFSSSVVSIAN
jgi:hypothetical protein